MYGVVEVGGTELRGLVGSVSWYQSTAGGCSWMHEGVVGLLGIDVKLRQKKSRMRFTVCELVGGTVFVTPAGDRELRYYYYIVIMYYSVLRPR